MASATLALIVYMLMFLLPINGLLLLAMRAEVLKKRRILRMMWKMGYAYASSNRRRK